MGRDGLRRPGHPGAGPARLRDPALTLVAAVDWSGRRVGAEAHIYTAFAEDGRLLDLVGGLPREAVGRLLIEAAAASGGDFAVGVDMAFSLPAWYLHRLGLSTAAELWALPEATVEVWLAECLPPFWGRPGRPRPADALERGFRATDLERLGRPKSPFQVGGAGAVGTGTLRGFALLHTLRSAGFRIWPFDDPERPLAVEIWPRLFMGRLNKSRLEHRLAFLRERGWPEPAARTDDAFDAAVSALSMSLRAAELRGLAPEPDPLKRLEGRIWF